eukprot:scaffold173526_cov35-Tisochrysis_lutea.AAC.2
MADGVLDAVDKERADRRLAIPLIRLLERIRHRRVVWSQRVLLGLPHPHHCRHRAGWRRRLPQGGWAAPRRGERG